MLRLIFIRHGQSEANLLHEFSNRGWKHPLTEAGRSQAEALAKHLEAEQVTRVYSSPVMRAVQTSQILCAHWQVACTITEALREYDVGIYEGCSTDDGWQAKQQVEEAWYARGESSRSLPDGESYLDIRARFVPFIDSLVRDERYFNATLALVSHGGLFNAMLPEVISNLTREVLFERPFRNCGYAVAEARPDGRLVLVSWKTDEPELAD